MIGLVWEKDFSAQRLRRTLSHLGVPRNPASALRGSVRRLHLFFFLCVLRGESSYFNRVVIGKEESPWLPKLGQRTEEHPSFAS